MSIVIKVFQLQDFLCEFELSEKEIFVGRSGESDIHLQDERCSSQHCSLRIVNGKTTVKDLDSRNGTFINDGQIREGYLHLGQTLYLGQSSIRLSGSQMSHEEKDLHTIPGLPKRKILDPSLGLKDLTQLFTGLFHKKTLPKRPEHLDTKTVKSPRTQLGSVQRPQKLGNQAPQWEKPLKSLFSYFKKGEKP